MLHHAVGEVEDHSEREFDDNDMDIQELLDSGHPQGISFCKFLARVDDLTDNCLSVAGPGRSNSSLTKQSSNDLEALSKKQAKGKFSLLQVSKDLVC